MRNRAAAHTEEEERRVTKLRDTQSVVWSVALCCHLVDVPAVRPVAGGSRWAGSTGVPGELQALHAGHSFVAGVRRAAGTRLVETCRQTGFNQVLRLQTELL